LSGNDVQLLGNDCCQLTEARGHQRLLVAFSF